ncbi:hypothetical protein DRZ78_03250 [Candidatus Aerophobetes bacterium]|uniref:Putative zinc-ribbon domain-containing protein n=1 Tax=Aerophobetes bacterium TaxID=2030807 RepID=A0A662D1Y6_UNCAE|nr:MAG: hypothetical protein DRZ78_03250 [Candidatus Aerophobetes bacterium]
MWAIAILIPFLIGLWVAMDARKRGYSQWKAFGWFLGVWLLLIIFLPLYFILRPKLSQKKGSGKGTHVCPYCGKLYTGRVSFCPYCGQKLDDVP